MSVTDYSVVRSDGSVGRMFADPSVDPETHVDSFARTSDTCVRFGGVGRIDTGELWEFFIDACDNGSPGTGVDTYTITLPDRSGPGNPFVRGGTLTEGEIVVRTF